jgi:hypothetical protein
MLQVSTLQSCQEFDSTTPVGFERLNGHAAADEWMALCQELDVQST